MIFQDIQVKSKIEEINKSFSDSGIPFSLGRKSDYIYFDVKTHNKDYSCLCLLYVVNSEVSTRWYEFESFTSKVELLTQLDFINRYVGVLKAICTIVGRHDFSPIPIFDCFSKRNLSFSYFDFKIVIEPMVLQDRFSVLVSSHGYKSCSDAIFISNPRFSKVVAQSEIGEKVKLKVESKEYNVKSSDLVSVIDRMIETLVGFMKDKTPLSLSLS